MDGYRTLKLDNPFSLMSTRGQKAITPVYCARRSRSGSRIALLSHCVHLKAKCQPDRLAFLSQNYSRAEHLLDPVVPHFVRVTSQIKSGDRRAEKRQQQRQR